jgi:hypothetical protein
VARSDLRDVLGLSARETANVLETTPVSIDSALQRAHKTVDDRLPRHSQQQTLRLLGDEQLSDLVERYITAWEQNDVDVVVSMLAEDAIIVMTSLPSWYSGRGQVAAFLRDYPLRGARRWKMVPTSANGQPALAYYEWNEQTCAFTPPSISVSRCVAARSRRSWRSSIRSCSNLWAAPSGLTIKDRGTRRQLSSVAGGATRSVFFPQRSRHPSCDVDD